MKSTNHIFISYAKEDADIAETLYAEIKKKHYSPWLDTKELVGGQEWRHEITRAIKVSRCFLAILSSSSISKRGFVQKELKTALDVSDEMPKSSVFIIPVRLDNCEPRDERIESLQWIDLFPSFDEGMKRIFEALQHADKRQEAHDSTSRRIGLERLTTDSLTGLKNRDYMWEYLRQIIEHDGGEDLSVTLLFLRIDNFGRYNDLYGHSAGDEILRHVAVLMRRCSRTWDVVGRLGGSEFAFVFLDDVPPGIAPAADDGKEKRSAAASVWHPRKAISLAKLLVRELEATELATSGDLGPTGKGILTISGGMATFPRDGRMVEELFEQAEKALLEARNSGGNRIYLVGKPSHKEPLKPAMFRRLRSFLSRRKREN